MSKGTKNKTRKICNFMFVGFWMVLLFSSLAFKASSKFFGWPDWNYFVIAENRQHIGKPDLRETPMRAWGTAIEAWYNDNFAWRSRLIQFYRFAHFNWMKTAVGSEVPGYAGWVFRRGGTWAELDDYLGGFELTEEEISDWVVLFEGRQQWAEAHGTRFMQVITSVKAQIHDEKVFPAIRNHRGVGVREQLQDRLVDSASEDMVVFAHEPLIAAARKRPVFYEEDHHINAYGVHLVYAAIADKLSEWFGGMYGLTFYDPPPADVLAGEAAGTFEQDRRLAVVLPGAKQIDDPLLAISNTGVAFPMASVAVRNGDGGGLFIVMANDSFMRFPLRTWDRSKAGEMRFPFNAGVGRMVSLLFLRYKTTDLEAIVSKEIPDVIIEQFTESRLSLGTLGLDETMRRASAFSRGEDVIGAPTAGMRVLARAVFDQVTGEAAEDQSVPGIKAELLEAGRVVAVVPLKPGVRRAVFFEAVESTGGNFSVRISGGHCDSFTVRLHTSRECVEGIISSSVGK